MSNLSLKLSGARNDIFHYVKRYFEKTSEDFYPHGWKDLRNFREETQNLNLWWTFQIDLVDYGQTGFNTKINLIFSLHQMRFFQISPGRSSVSAGFFNFNFWQFSPLSVAGGGREGGGERRGDPNTRNASAISHWRSCWRRPLNKIEHSNSSAAKPGSVVTLLDLIFQLWLVLIIS